MQSESLADVKVFLRDILVQEKLSCTAEKERLRLLRFLDSREISPPPYLNMSPNNKYSKIERDKIQTNECYEEFPSTKSSIDNCCDKIKGSRSSSARSSCSLYCNIAQAFRSSSSSLDVNDERLPVPQKELRHSFSNSATASIRNSLTSLTAALTNNKRAGSDSPDALSEASSSASNNCSSKSAPTSQPEVLTVSASTPRYSTISLSTSQPEVLTVCASALRYSATKCGLLSRKEKFFFLDHYKQYWVGLLGHTLYVYCSDKDSKPILEVDVEGYQARPVGLKDSQKKDSSFEIFCPGKKTYQFTASCASEMDQWISTICQAGKVPDSGNTTTSITTTTTKTEQTAHRQLPSLPAELMYDHPDSVIRPVTPRSPGQYEIMNSNVDDFYYYISNDQQCPINEKGLYKNVEEMTLLSKEKEENFDENFYYNLAPTENGELECIYDTIREAGQGDQGDQEEEIVQSPVPVSGRIQQIIQQIEAAAAGNSSKHTSLIQDELYEPVNSPEENNISRTVSR
ncbi:uncharacterized protein LOC142326326 [Lycorma delicatula]|uniref:uncharacterized protein LOC142326326 n=1 Tax=Lycorma delicatula TaxID=130591 RepID=UPI003F514756